METRVIIVWFRADLRVHDHRALAAASADGTLIVPVFILNDDLLKGASASANRNRFLIECLEDLKKSLQKLGADLVIRSGDASEVLRQVAKETNASSVYYIADFSPYAIARDKKVKKTLEGQNISVKSFGGKLAVNSLQKIVTKTGSPYKVFTPFWKAWSGVERVAPTEIPEKLTMPKIAVGSIPAVTSLTKQKNLSPQALTGGETEGRKRLHAFLDGPIRDYKKLHGDLGAEGTSRISSYLHFGCLSAQEIETMLPDSLGARSWHRQLAWREFYYYVLFHFPHPEHEFQERYHWFGCTVVVPIAETELPSQPVA